MMLRLIRHEFRRLASDRAFHALTALLVLTLAFGLWNGERWVSFQRGAIASAEREAAAALTRAKTQADDVRAGREELSWWKSAADTRGFVESHLLSYASKPPAPLAAFAVGQSDLYPYLLKVSPETPLGRALDSYENVNPRKLLLGPFDLAFAIGFLLPLFILALCYDLLSSEREQGILVLLASQPISLARLVAAKVLARLVVVLAAVLASLLLVLTATGALANDGAVVAMLAFAGVVLVYSLFWFLLAVFVVAQGWTSATNAFALAMIWLVLVALAPSAMSLGVESAYPTPSRLDYIETLRDESAAIRRDRQQIADAFFADHPGLRPAADDKAKEANYFIRVLEIGRRLQAVEARFDEQLRLQQDLGERLKFLSPATLAHSAFVDLAGSGLAQQRRFLDQVASHHRELTDYFFPMIIRGDYDFHGYDEVPRFRYRSAESLDLDACLAALGALIAQAAPLGLLGFLRLRKYPVVRG